jgi:hypothetical protein
MHAKYMESLESAVEKNSSSILYQILCDKGIDVFQKLCYHYVRKSKKSPLFCLNHSGHFVTQCSGSLRWSVKFSPLWKFRNPRRLRGLFIKRLTKNYFLNLPNIYITIVSSVILILPLTKMTSTIKVPHGCIFESWGKTS